MKKVKKTRQTTYYVVKDTATSVEQAKQRKVMTMEVREITVGMLLGNLRANADIRLSLLKAEINVCDKFGHSAGNLMKLKEVFHDYVKTAERFQTLRGLIVSLEEEEEKI